MTIRYKCAECGAALNINDELAGTEGNCPRCQVQFTVPAPDADASTEPVAPRPAAQAKQRSGGHSDEGPLSDDDIGAFLNADPAPSSGRPVSTADSDDELPAEQVNPFDEEPEEAESEKRSRKQKARRAGSEAAKSDSSKSASIAQSLMGRGGSPIAEPDESQKKKRKQFGGREERHEGELTSYKDVITYFAKLGWPFAVGGGTFLALCIWLMFSMFKSFTPIAPLAPVTGTITLDGKPLKMAIVKFVPQFEGPDGYLKGSTSFGFTDAAGKYTLTYANDDGKPIMGAIIGKHQVQIQLNDLGGAQLVPPRYSTSQSELKAEVAKGKGPVNFELKSDPVEKTE